MSRESLKAIADTGLSMSREEFVQKFPEPFMVVESAESSGPAPNQRAFKTMIGGVNAAQKANPLDDKHKHVYRLQKSDRNRFGAMITVGRADNNDLILEHLSVSKFHAYFTSDPKRTSFSVNDADSKFGTFVDNKKLPPNIARELTSGDTVTFGKGPKLTFYLASDFYDYLKLLRGLRKI